MAPSCDGGNHGADVRTPAALIDAFANHPCCRLANCVVNLLNLPRPTLGYCTTCFAKGQFFADLHALDRTGWIDENLGADTAEHVKRAVDRIVRGEPANLKGMGAHELEQGDGSITEEAVQGGVRETVRAKRQGKDDDAVGRKPSLKKLGTLQDDADASMARDCGRQDRRGGHQLGHVGPQTACAVCRQLAAQESLLEGSVSSSIGVVNVSHCN